MNKHLISTCFLVLSLALVLPSSSLNSAALTLHDAAQGGGDGAANRVSRSGPPVEPSPGSKNVSAALVTTITISGAVTGPGGPVPNAWIGVNGMIQWRETTTNALGFYSVTIQTEGDLVVHVRPDHSTRLTQANHSLSGVTGNVTQNFSLTTGNLLSLRLTGSGGAPVTGEFYFDTQPLQATLAGAWWYNMYWDDASQRWEGVLPPDVYYVHVRHLPDGYYETTAAFDLRAGDRMYDMPLNTMYVHPIPYEPPQAAKITIGTPDDLGEATVTGAAGAVLPLAHVFLVNLNSANQAYTISGADGSFSAKIYAPPGSSIMIKHGGASWRWNDLAVGVSEQLNPYPGTIVYVPHTHTAQPGRQPFAAAGGIDQHIDDPNTTRNTIGAAWAMTGTLQPVVVDGQWARALDGKYNGQDVRGLYLGGLNWTHPALGDLDGDGDLDLVVGERSGRLVLYRNQGTPPSPSWRFETAGFAGVDTGDWAYPALADATGDGKLDLFVGAGGGAVDIYYNHGTTSVPQWSAQPDASVIAGNDASPALDDVDGDSKLDLIVGHQGGRLYHFKNTGTLSSPVWTQQTDSYGGVSESGGVQPAFVNLDGDTDRDMLVGLCGQMIWYRRGGTVGSPTWTRQASDPIDYGGGSCGTSPGVGNWDNDGDKDLVVGEHWGVLRFFRNDTPPTWTGTGFQFPFDLSGDSAPALADWNGDGDLDMLIGQAHGNVYQYTNVGTATAPDWRPDGVLLTLPWTNHPHAFPALADIDGDHDYDLFVGVGGWGSPGMGGTIHFYRNAGSSSSPNWTLVVTNYLGLDVGGWSTPAFVDIDADGDLDLFVGDEVGTLTFVQNTGTSTLPGWAAPVHPYAGLSLGDYSAPSFFDVDDDGDLDMLVGLGHGSLAYVRNTGSVHAPAWELVSTVYPSIDVGDHATPVAANITGDATPELLVGTGDGGLHVYRYDGPGSGTVGNVLAPGDLFNVTGKLRLYSPSITTTTDVGAISVNGSLQLMMQHNAQGRPIAAENYYMSTLLTPGGLPIQRAEWSLENLNAPVSVGNLHYAGGHRLEGDVNVTSQIPDDLPVGIYRPAIFFNFSGVPTSTQWLGANVVYHTLAPNEALLPPVQVSQTVPAPRLAWQLLMDDFVQGTRGTSAREDRGVFGLASQIVSQGSAYYTPPVDERTGQPIVYRLEPFLPMISYTDRRMPTPPLIPFKLPGGQLRVAIQQPDGTVRDLGAEPFAQSFNRTKTTRDGNDLNGGTVQLEDVYSLKVAHNRFRTTFSQYGHHVITMTGAISDVWGHAYTGGGTYDVWVAHPLDIDPGVLPGTPLAVGDAFNPAMQFYPPVPADVRLDVTLYPDSDPAQAVTRTLTGQANPYGYFSSPTLITMTRPGEYRVDLTALYTDPTGKLYMGSMTWGGVVMTPDAQSDLVAHGRRGLDSLTSIPNHWFVSSRDLTIPAGAISHSLNPYYNGDILWSRMSDNPWGGDSLILGASVQDTVGVIQAAVQARASRMNPRTSTPGDLSERFAKNEIPLFTSTRSGRTVQLDPGDVDQIAYSYSVSERPGVRVREVVAEDGHSGGYWRLDTLYDDQLSVGIQGDLPNDFKFQYVGAVYRDLVSGHSEYRGQGTGWIFIPDSDTTGSRVMPPFAGPGNGGWTTEGGPILTLKGKDVHIFIMPTGTLPGAILSTGDTFHFAGHLLPTLNSKVAVTVTSPSGVKHSGGGRANSIGYFYDPADNLIVSEPGLWSVDVRVWHDGQCSGGSTIPPYPSGDVLGSENGRYWFYVVPGDASRLVVTSPSPGYMTFEDQVTPITITGSVPPGLSGVTIDYTIAMPGYILKHGQVTPTGSTFQVVFDPAALQQDYANLDLIGRDPNEPGLADTIAVGLLMRGQSGGETVYSANTVTFQGQQVYRGDVLLYKIHLPLVLK